MGSKQPGGLFFEKAYLHTDREAYTGGEDVWFKAYLVNAQTNQLIGSSNNLYVELISPDLKLSDRKTIRLDKGLGKGDFRLGDSIAPGTYRIRAYTSWMRNFGEYFIFEKSIRVVSRESAPKPERKAKGSKGAVAAGTDFSVSTTFSSLGIRFFPEGGSMIEGVAGMVAFKAEDEYGRGIAASGSIASPTGELLTEFSCGVSGMGSVMVMPHSGITLEVKGAFGNGKPFSTRLPQALAEGFSINVRAADSLLNVTIGTNEATLSRYRGQVLLITGKSRGKSCYSAGFALKTLSSTLTIPKSSFPSGIAAITLYDQTGKPHAERLIHIAVPEKESLALSTDKLLYGPKEKTSLSIRVIGTDNQPVRANLSATVVDASIADEGESNIVSYLGLESEIRGRIENPAQYFDRKNALAAKRLDLLLMTQGWRDFVWKRLADSALKISYPAEQGITVSGRVRETAKDKPIAGANITLFAPKAKGNTLFSARTDSLGRYYIDHVPLYGSQPIRLGSKNDRGEKKGMIILDSLGVNPATIRAWPNVPADTSTGESGLEQKLEQRRLEAAKRFKDTIVMKEITLKASKYLQIYDGMAISFGYRDDVLKPGPKDYDYQDLRHYLLHKTSYFATIDEDNCVKFGVGVYPHLFINNREMIFDRRDPLERLIVYTPYLSLPVEKVEKILIKRMILNNPGGTQEDIYIVYLTLKPGTMEPARYDAVAANVTGYYEARTFYAPRYETPGSKADYRNTIHWEPNISTNERGEATVTFYNADPKTRVRVVVEGITDKGIPVRATAGYEVK